MTTTGPGDVLSGGEPAGATARDAVVAAPDGTVTAGDAAVTVPDATETAPGATPPGGPDTLGRALPGARGDGAPGGLSALPAPLRTATRGTAVLLVGVCLLHLFFLFLHVAPTNQISQRYDRQLQGWVYPLFEQNWRLFAPDPESAVPQISVRTARASAGGMQRVSGWLDLTAIDDAGVRHDPFPSHTTQNMLRRAWTGYLDTHGSSDVSYSERALMWQEYLRNIAVQRAGSVRTGAITFVQLRVRTTPVGAYDAAGHVSRVPASAVSVRNLPWWKVPAHDH